MSKQNKEKSRQDVHQDMLDGIFNLVFSTYMQIANDVGKNAANKHIVNFLRRLTDAFEKATENSEESTNANTEEHGTPDVRTDG